MQNASPKSTGTVSLNIPSRDFQVGKKIGAGVFGTVYQGSYKFNSVAIKEFDTRGAITPEKLKELKEEALLMAQLGAQCQQLVKLIGVNFEQPFRIIMELLTQGNLYDLLRSNTLPSNWLSLPQPITIARDIAIGLHFLHSYNPVVIHQDIKSLNVLLDEHLSAKLGDYGLAKMKHTSSSSSSAKNAVGILPWMAPELLSEGDPIYSEASDVYGYGQVLWEMAMHESPKTPFGSAKNAALLINKIIQNKLDPVPPRTPAYFSDLIVKTRDKEPTNRPLTKAIIEQLSQAYRTQELEEGMSDLIISNEHSQPSNSSLGESSSQQNSSSLLLLSSAGLSEATDYEKAINLYNKCKFQQCLPYFLRISCNESHPYYLGACFKLWCIYNIGLGVAKNQNKAEIYLEIITNNIEWFLFQANKSPDAMINLGLLYSEGQGVAQDYQKARELYEQAAAQGYTEAQYNLGFLYYYGQDIAQDYQKARYWFEQAAAQGYAGAQNNLGFLYNHGQGVAQNYQKARYWYKQAATQGNAFAQNNLGDLYYYSQGVPQDFPKARYWYEQAATQGNAFAQYNLGILYHNGQGVPQDYQKAHYWFEQAAAQGNAAAQSSLGILYKNGQGVLQDYQKAYYWFEQAAAQGNAVAQSSLGILYYYGEGVTQDYHTAYTWFEQAAMQGNAEAQCRLGEFYKKGLRVAKNIRTATMWYRRAAAQGYDHAIEALDSLSRPMPRP